MNYSNYEYTKHFTDRMNQRGISDDLIEIVLEHGETHFHHGGEVTRVPKKTIKRLRNATTYSNQLLDKAKKVYIVEDAGTLITNGHQHKKFKRDA
jgi:hypothetical protein